MLCDAQSLRGPLWLPSRFAGRILLPCCIIEAKLNWRRERDPVNLVVKLAVVFLIISVVCCGEKQQQSVAVGVVYVRLRLVP